MYKKFMGYIATAIFSTLTCTITMLNARDAQAHAMEDALISNNFISESGDDIKRMEEAK